MDESVFSLLIEDQLVTPPRYVNHEGKLVRANMEDDPTVVPLRPQQTLGLSFTTVMLDQPRPMKVFFFGELERGQRPKLTKFAEVSRSRLPDPEKWKPEDTPMLAYPERNTVLIFLQEGAGAVPTFQVIERSPEHSPHRHFLIGDLWEGEPWFHSVKALSQKLNPSPQPERPRRRSASRFRT